MYSALDLPSVYKINPFNPKLSNPKNTTYKPYSISNYL